MNTVEMLDELQNKALHDEKLKNRFLETRKRKMPSELSVVYAENWDMIFIRWTLFRQVTSSMRR